MTEPRRFTSSELRLYQRCRRSWYVRYYLGYAPRRDAGDVSVSRVGTLVHLGVEAYYKTGDWAEGLRAVSLAVVDNLRELEEAHDGGARSAKVVSNGELVRIMLEGYFEWLEETGADADLATEAVESEISAPILDGRAVLLGKVDRTGRRRSTGRTVILDTKSCQGVRDQEILAPMNPQFKHYAVIERLNGNDRIEGAEVRWMRRVKRTARSKPPYYGIVQVQYPTAVLRGYYTQTLSVVREILGKEACLRSGLTALELGLGPTVDRACSYCPYRPVCPMLDDETVSETDMLQWSYEKVDPLARYAEPEFDGEGDE